MLVIRPAHADDLPGIYEIFRDAVLNTTAIWIDDPGTLEDRRAWLLLKEAQGFPVFVAVEDGAVLGYATLGEFRPFYGFRATAEHSIYVAPSARRRGVGWALLEELIRAARGIGRNVLVAAVDATNEGSLALHRGFGFKETGRMPGVGRKFGRSLDLVLLQKEL